MPVGAILTGADEAESEEPTPTLPSWVARKSKAEARRQRTESEDLVWLKQSQFTALAEEEREHRKTNEAVYRWTGKKPRPRYSRHEEAAKLMRQHLKKHQPRALRALRASAKEPEQEDKPARTFLPRLFGRSASPAKSKLRIVFTPSVDRDPWKRADPQRRAISSAPGSVGSMSSSDWSRSNDWSRSDDSWGGGVQRSSSKLAVLSYSPRLIQGPMTEERAWAWQEHEAEQRAYELEQSAERRALLAKEANESRSLQRQASLLREARKGHSFIP